LIQFSKTVAALKTGKNGSKGIFIYLKKSLNNLNVSNILLQAISCIFLAFFAGRSLCEDSGSTLPVLYRVDQPTSNVVVFRGADVALARAAGLIKSSAFNEGIVGNTVLNNENQADGQSAPALAPFVPTPLPQLQTSPPAVLLPQPAAPVITIAQPLAPLPIVTRTPPLAIQTPTPSYSLGPVSVYEPEPHVRCALTAFCIITF